MHRGDVRAVENPISAIFDLAEDVNERLPKVRKVLRYTRIFVTFWLFVDALVIIAFPGALGAGVIALFLLPVMYLLYYARRWTDQDGVRTLFAALAFITAVPLVLFFGAAFLFGIVFVGLFLLGLVILELLADLRRFLDYYALRHRVVKSVRDQDPVVYIPTGNTIVQRLLAYLAGQSPPIRMLVTNPQTTRVPAILQGRSGMQYQFDAFIGTGSTPLFRLMGSGSPGFGVFVKAFDHPPTRQDMEFLKRAAEDVSLGMHAPPSRVIAVWRAIGEQSVDEGTYEYVTSQVVSVPFGSKTFDCSLEVITETADGTYDFIPFVSDGVHAAGA